MRIRFRAINYKGKRLYVFDEKGKYVRENNKFIKIENLKNKDPQEAILKKEFNKITKGYPYIKSKLKYIKNIDKKIYYAKTWIITESNDLTQLTNHNKRGFRKYHLDHIYSISQGYKNNIPPEAIGHIDNLRFIHYKKNLKKRDKIDEFSKNLMLEIVNKLTKI